MNINKFNSLCKDDTWSTGRFPPLPNVFVEGNGRSV